MTFTCVTCGDDYLDTGGEPGVTVGICEPCGERQLGPEKHEIAASRALQTHHRELRKS